MDACGLYNIKVAIEAKHVNGTLETVIVYHG